MVIYLFLHQFPLFHFCSAIDYIKKRSFTVFIYLTLRNNFFSFPPNLNKVLLFIKLDSQVYIWPEKKPVNFLLPPTCTLNTYLNIKSLLTKKSVKVKICPCFVILYLLTVLFVQSIKKIFIFC